jgi:hypothetical protein
VEEPADYFTNTVAITNATGAWPTWASDTLYTLADNLAAGSWGNLNIATGNPGVHDVWIMGNPSAPAVVGGNVTVGRSNPGSANIAESYCIGLIGITGALEVGVDYGRAVNFYHVDGRHIFTAINEHYTTYGGTNFKRPSQISFSRCDMLGASNVYPYYSQRGDEYCAVLDCSLQMQASGASAIHVMRSAGTYHSVVAHNKMWGLSTEGAYCTMRAKGTAAWTRQYDVELNPLTSQVVVADNIFGDVGDSYASNLPTSAMPTNTSENATIVGMAWISNTWTNNSGGGASGEQLRFAGKNLGAINCTGLSAAEIRYYDETDYTFMQHTDFYPVYSEHGFNEGYLADERITLPAFEDPGKAGS